MKKVNISIKGTIVRLETILIIRSKQSKII